MARERAAKRAAFGIGLFAACLLLAAAFSSGQQAGADVVQFVFTSDAHYGLVRDFRGRPGVPAHLVNAAMVSRINALSRSTFPRDGGVMAGAPVGGVDFLAQGGDIANREEVIGDVAIQSAAASWSQFTADYIDGLTLTTRAGTRSPVYMVPGNHDVSNAVGFYRPMMPLLDRTAVVGIYNRVMAPSRPLTTSTWDVAKGRVMYTRDVGGIHFMFFQVWADSAVRAWMESDLARVPAATPVILFTHDQPDVEAKHFVNPGGSHDINTVNQFENLLADTFAGATVDEPSVTEQRAFEACLARHPNVTAYFHGNSNWNQFYDWNGPDRSIVLHTFRVDSPMKGAVSAGDESRLSFHVATLDTVSRVLTVREYLWNRASAPWGTSTTVTLAPRPRPVGTAD